MSLLRLVQRVKYRPGKGHIGDVYLVSKLVGGRTASLEREAKPSAWTFGYHIEIPALPKPWIREYDLVSEKPFEI